MEELRKPLIAWWLPEAVFFAGKRLWRSLGPKANFFLDRSLQNFGKWHENGKKNGPRSFCGPTPPRI